MFQIAARNAVIFVAWLLAGPAAAETAHEDIAASENFQLICRDASKRGRSVAPEVVATAPRILELMEDARSWLQELDFPVERSNLTKRSGLQVLVIDPKPPGAGACSDAAANACYGNDLTGLQWIFLPQAKVRQLGLPAGGGAEAGQSRQCRLSGVGQIHQHRGRGRGCARFAGYAAPL